MKEVRIAVGRDPEKHCSNYSVFWDCGHGQFNRPTSRTHSLTLIQLSWGRHKGVPQIFCSELMNLKAGSVKIPCSECGTPNSASSSLKEKLDTCTVRLVFPRTQSGPSKQYSENMAALRSMEAFYCFEWAELIQHDWTQKNKPNNMAASYNGCLKMANSIWLKIESLLTYGVWMDRQFRQCASALLTLKIL